MGLKLLLQNNYKVLPVQKLSLFYFAPFFRGFVAVGLTPSVALLCPLFSGVFRGWPDSNRGFTLPPFSGDFRGWPDTNRGFTLFSVLVDWRSGCISSRVLFCFVLWGLTPHSVFLPECDLRKGLVFVLFYFTTLVGAFWTGYRSACPASVLQI